MDRRSGDMGIDGGEATMKSRLGVDITSVIRIKEAATRQPRLVTRLFTPREIQEAGQGRQRWPRLASRFAAKEALIKAAGGLRGSRYRDIEVRRVPGAAAELRVSGTLGAWLEHVKLDASLSLSHEDHYAVAVVMLEPQGGVGGAADLDP